MLGRGPLLGSGTAARMDFDRVRDWVRAMSSAVLDHGRFIRGPICCCSNVIVRRRAASPDFTVTPLRVPKRAAKAAGGFAFSAHVPDRGALTMIRHGRSWEQSYA